MSTSHTLPIITVQPTFPSIIKEVDDGLIPSDKFWVSCYKTGEPSVHAKIRAELDERKRDLVNLSAEGEGLGIEGDGGKYTIACEQLGIPPTRIVTPVQEYADAERSNPQRPQRITAFSISPDSSRFATGFLDGTVLLYPSRPLPTPSSSSSRYPTPQSIETSRSKITSRPQLSSVTSLRFFPSSRVLLSAGADFALAILPAELPSPFPSSETPTRVTPVRILRSHTRSITSTGIISVGRNILSSSLDSTLKLWDVPSGSVISSLPAASAVLCTSLGGRGALPGTEGEAGGVRDEREVRETRDHVVFAGLQNGSFELFDLGTKKSAYRSPAAGRALSAIGYSPQDNLLATGSSEGMVTLYDTRNLGTSLTSFTRTSAGVEDLAFLPSSSSSSPPAVELAIATTDGLPYIASLSLSPSSSPRVAAELIGVDCDPVRHVRVRGGEGGREVWNASDDGIVRRYLL